MITGRNSLKTFSVMIADWETNFTDLQAKITDIKLVEGALLSLSLSLSPPSFSFFFSLSLSLFLFLSLLVSPSLAFSLLAACPFFLCRDWSHPSVRFVLSAFFFPII